MKNYNIGIDLGSRTSKIVVLHKDEIAFTHISDSGVNPKEKSERLLQKAFKNLKISKEDVKSVFSTGYGRKVVPFADKRISEISCHAKGVNFFFPKARTVIDIGGQDSKIILLNEFGKVLDFVMNDRCAAGTGKFLEVAAITLETTVDELGIISRQSSKNVDINSTCVVFAESEIIGLIASEMEKADIVNGIHHSVAKRTKNLIARLNWQNDVIFTGGVAKNSGMQKTLSEMMNTTLSVPQNPFITGALGAAIFAKESL
ncbi:MAG: 2-hydroxyglutaryl-CoA dehydratase [Candidatus Cloacimonetes bacterium]|nr:2-hydroxyglutaryl-CoA dehydratase [Candidatus Cloacimonadota bacterium]MBT7469050.1 2-hydroxyglutaryl-CoA dehydratase [Candidatus Cloacimonadota bacterium]